MQTIQHLVSWKEWLCGTGICLAVYYVFIFVLFRQAKRKEKVFPDMEKTYGEK